MLYGITLICKCQQKMYTHTQARAHNSRIQQKNRLVFFLNREHPVFLFGYRLGNLAFMNSEKVDFWRPSFDLYVYYPKQYNCTLTYINIFTVLYNVHVIHHTECPHKVCL